MSIIGGTAQSSSRGSGRVRSRSVSKEHEEGTQQIQDRMKFSVDFKKKGFKPNTRGHSIQDSFTTLDEILAELPESIGFNIEISRFLGSNLTFLNLWGCFNRVTVQNTLEFQKQWQLEWLLLPLR